MTDLATNIQRFLVHFLIALTVSFALSIFFWLALNVFILTGFILWSVVCAAAGAAIGYFLLRRIIWTVVATIVLRVALFLVMTQVV